MFRYHFYRTAKVCFFLNATNNVANATTSPRRNPVVRCLFKSAACDFFISILVSSAVATIAQKQYRTLVDVLNLQKVRYNLKTYCKNNADI